MEGSGCNAEEARTVAQRLVDSNLVGHDSHGTLKPNTAPSIVFDNDSIAIVDGHRGFGQVTGEFATRLGIAKAARSGIAMVGLRNCGHLGRLGDFRLPQRGICVVGHGRFDPFDPYRHRNDRLGSFR